MKTKQTKQNKKAKACKNSRPLLGECTTQKWLSSNRTRPKTVVLTLNRTTNGAYTIEEAFIMKRVNQYGATPIIADVRAITEDLNRRGVAVR
jgi:hypothetical protein